MDKLTLSKLNYGLYIVTSKYENEFSGCVVNTVTQITAEDKPKFIVAINKQNYTSEIIEKSKKINISILSQKTDMLQIGKFGFRSGKDINKLEGTEYILGKNNVPIVTQNTVAYLECNVINILDCNTHNLFVLELQDAEFVNKEDISMTYDYYHTVIKGKTPPKASTYLN